MPVVQLVIVVKLVSKVSQEIQVLLEEPDRRVTRDLLDKLDLLVSQAKRECVDHKETEDLQVPMETSDQSV